MLPTRGVDRLQQRERSEPIYSGIWFSTLWDAHWHRLVRRTGCHSNWGRAVLRKHEMWALSAGHLTDALDIVRKASAPKVPVLCVRIVAERMRSSFGVQKLRQLVPPTLRVLENIGILQASMAQVWEH